MGANKTVTAKERARIARINAEGYVYVEEYQGQTIWCRTGVKRYSGTEYREYVIDDGGFQGEVSRDDFTGLCVEDARYEIGFRLQHYTAEAVPS